MFLFNAVRFFFPVIQISNSAEGGSLVKDIPSTKDGRVDWSQVKLQNECLCNLLLLKVKCFFPILSKFTRIIFVICSVILHANSCSSNPNVSMSLWFS